LSTAEKAHTCTYITDTVTWITLLYKEIHGKKKKKKYTKNSKFKENDFFQIESSS
jgi:hypothetical protein